MEQPHEAATIQEERKPSFFSRHRTTLLSCSALLVVFALGGVGLTANESYHKQRIFHGVSVGSLDLGGLKTDEAKAVLSAWHDRWWNEGIAYRLEDEQGNVLTELEVLPILVAEEEGVSHELVTFDLDQTVENAYLVGRDPSWFRRLNHQVSLLLSPVSLVASLHIDEDGLSDLLTSEFGPYETPAQNAEFTQLEEGAEVLPETQGMMFNHEAAVSLSRQKLLSLDTTPIVLQRISVAAEITTAEVEEALRQIEPLKSLFPFTLRYHDPRIDFERSWTVTWKEVAPALTVLDHQGNPLLGVDPELLSPLWGRIETLVNEEPHDAKFAVSDTGKVEQFQPSQKGYLLDHVQTAARINTWLGEYLKEAPIKEDQEPSAVDLVVQVIEPKVPTAEVNNLGITEILGVGYSNFAGSPANRVHNIAVGADKLNGLLVEPGEEFSLLQALKPFTFAEGYLPELVIKGDKIEPEIGGGLCQIGSTTFRAAMKSGLPITQRSNHSLVVSYYNDPRNGNPGTDATIYDPAPDFRFMNDTGNSILIQTTMDKSTGELYFTFWGTSDGRSADYTEPVVNRWIGTGPTKYIETTDLEPGQQKCQGAHIGAETSFTYSVTMPDGELKERVFTSSYRPLPTICLVGIDPQEQDEKSSTETEGVQTPSDTASQTPATEEPLL